MADHPLRPATRHRLGRPLPYQLADTPQPYLTAVETFPLSGIWGISPGFPGLSPTAGQVATCYAPVRRSPALYPKIKPAAPRLACVKHAASVHSEPGSNSPLKLLLLIQFNLCFSLKGIIHTYVTDLNIFYYSYLGYSSLSGMLLISKLSIISLTLPAF